MNTLALPICRHRGEQFTPGQWVCSSPRLVIPGGIVTAEVCRHECPYADHDDDLPPGCLPSDAAEETAQAATPLAVAADPESIAVAMITAPRPVPTVERSLHELRRAGFAQTICVFEEPGTDLALRPGVRLFSNAERLGPWPNWRRAAASLLELTDTPFLLICEDDICLRPDAALGLLYAVQTLPRDDWGYVSLYTPWHNVRGQTLVSGWQALPVGDNGWGALAYCFTRDSLQALLTFTAPLAACAEGHTDLFVSSALGQLGRSCYFHVPSLGDHTGEGISSLGHRHLPEMAAVDYQPNAHAYVRDLAPPRTVERPASLPRVGQISVSGASVAVIVPTYNCAAYLGDCVRSLRRQTVPCEIVVVDDGSTDETAGVLAELGGAVRVLHHERNEGANAARNTGLRATDSDWVVLADADAVYAPHFLETLLDRAAAGVSLVYGPYQLQDAASGTVTRIPAQPWDAEALWWSNYISMCSLIRREALPAQLPSQDHFDDWALWLDLAERGHRGARVAEVTFTAFLRRDGKTSRLRNDPHVLRREVAHYRRKYAHLIAAVEPIAVVIPARECLDLTLRCLDHLSWYAGLPVEVIYVDNGSPVSVPAAVEAAAARLGLPFTVLRNDSRAQFTQAVNQGIRLADGRHVLVLNNDCFVGPDCLERLYWHLTRSPHRVGAVGPLTGDGENQSLRHAARRFQAGIAPDLELDYQDALAGASAARPLSLHRHADAGLLLHSAPPRRPAPVRPPGRNDVRLRRRVGRRRRMVLARLASGLGLEARPGRLRRPSRQSDLPAPGHRSPRPVSGGPGRAGEDVPGGLRT